MTREGAIAIMDKIRDHYEHLIFSNPYMARSNGKSYQSFLQRLEIFEAIEMAKKALEQMRLSENEELEEKNNDL